MQHLIRFLHILFGITFAGLFVANYFYLYLTMQEKNNTLLTFTLKRSLFSDCIFSFPAIMIILTTGSFQVIFSKFSATTPWIISAYVFFIMVICFSVIMFLLKSYNYTHITAQKPCVFVGKFLFHFLYIGNMLLLIFIIHDAVRKMTFIPWQKIY